MRLAFALYKYFPYGGLARDFVRIAEIFVDKGYAVDVYVMDWQGDNIKGFNLHVLPCKGWSNHAKVADFHRQLSGKLENQQYDAVIGFNKIPNLDVYYAADPCYVDRFSDKHFLNKLNPRYRFYAGVEKAIFGVDSKTVCLMISDGQTELFKKHYNTPTKRLVLLPPGIELNRRKSLDAKQRRVRFRQAHNLDESEQLVLMLGTGFKTKGVDRAITAFASLPEAVLSKSNLMVVGEDDIPVYERLAREKGVTKHVRFMGGRADVPDFLLAADVLLHPARNENTGTVILEAMVAGLPMLVTDVCGYAKHVKKSKAGMVLDSPFSQRQLNEKLMKMLTSDKHCLIQKALDYADSEDLYSMPEKAVEAIEQVAKDHSNAV